MDLDIPIAIRKSTRKCTQHPIANFISFHKIFNAHRTFLTKLHITQTPKTVQEALKSKEWKKAMNEKMKALKKNETWYIVVMQKEIKMVGCKWVYTINYNVNGSLERYKERLVAKGYTHNIWSRLSRNICTNCKNEYNFLLSLAANL